MAKLNIPRARDLLQKFDFDTLFIEELGWSMPGSRKSESKSVSGAEVSSRQIAELGGVVVLEITNPDGRIPDAKQRKAIHKEIAKSYHENLLIFTDKARTQSLWYWAKRENGKVYPRDHSYFKGQPGDLFISKLSGIVFDIKDFEKSGNMSVVEVAGRLKSALDVERVTKRFYGEFQDQHIAFLELIEGIPDEQERRWYASVLLNRLMFIYFLQKKGFIDGGEQNYLQNKLNHSKEKSKNRYYSEFLKALFFEGFAKPEDQRSAEARRLLGKIKYLNGGLFLPHSVELGNPKITIPDKAFENLLELFQRYSWNLNDTPGGEDNEINPDVLGYIFEKYINQKAFGAYYTRPEITEYLCERTIQNLVLDKVNTPGIPGVTPARHFDSIGDLLLNLDANLCRQILFDVLPGLSILDPACGSGAFLVAAMKTLINIYSALIGKIEFMTDQSLTRELKKIKSEHPSVGYFIKKRIITENLFGVDIMEEAVEIAKLRLFLALVAAANTEDDLEPLPNIDFNIQTGNSLIGLIRVDAAAFDASGGVGVQKRLKMRYENEAGGLGLAIETTVAPSKKEKVAEYLAERSQKKYQQILEEKNRLIKAYRDATSYAEDLRSLRDKITEHKQAATETLNSILLDEFRHLEIKYEQATWDDERNTEGKPIKRPLKQSDIEELKPFHWGFEFDEIINHRGGFDAIITNPPWEVFEPSAKEFFQEHSDIVSKNKMSLRDFEKERTRLLKDENIRKAWLQYLSRYPHLARYFKSASQYSHQLSMIDGKIAASKTNLYKLFVELVYRLLRDGGACGMVIPDGIYNARGTTQLRRLLIDQTQITGLFCIENRNEVFENVHRSFKIVILTFKKGPQTVKFPAAFMRTEVADLEHFPTEDAVMLGTDLIRELSPDMLAFTELKSGLDISIVRKFLNHPRLDQIIPGSWNLSLCQEFNMTSDSALFRSDKRSGRLPLIQGGMIHQFDANFAEPKFWIEETAGRKAVLGKTSDSGQKLVYEHYRFAHRRIARSTDVRAAIACILPPKCFCADTAQTTRDVIAYPALVFFTAAFNSFVADWELRLRITTHVDMHFVYAMRIPRLPEKEKDFWPIVTRAAKLICTTSAFDELAKSAGLKGWKEGVTDQNERLKIRAELDGMIAHLYGLTDEEFSHILSTFPIVPEPVKSAALEAYRKTRV